MFYELERGKKWEHIIEHVKASFGDGTFPPGNERSHSNTMNVLLIYGN